MRKIILCSIFLIFFFFIFASYSFAQVVINEFLPINPSGGDWIELYNNSDSQVDISGWKADDSTGNMKTFSSGTTVSSHGFYHFEVAIRLNNDGDTIYLKDQNDNLKDSKGYSSNPGENVSIGRTPDGVDNWVTFSSSTPGSSNGSPPATSSPTYPSNISLSEFMPNPDEETEWVEIYNDNDNTADLSGWRIDDIEGGSSPQHFNAQIPAKSFYVVYLDSARLNNDGDSVRLIRPDDSEADKANYSSSQNGIAWAKDGGQWSETSTPTPGQVNKITSTEAGEESTSNASPSPTTKSTSKSTPTSTQNIKTQETTKSYKTDTPNYDWEKQENPTPESSAISLVLGEKTDNPPKKIPIHIIFIFAGLFFFTAAFFPQIKTKIQDFLEERFQSQL